MSMSGSKIREQVAHFLVDIHIPPLCRNKTMVLLAGFSFEEIFYQVL